MSESSNESHGESTLAVNVDIRAWVDAVRSDPIRHRERQVTEVLLASVGASPLLRESLVLKGGTAMALAFDSARLTGDVDFSSDAEPGDFPQKLADELNRLLPRTAIRIGYVDLLCRVQSMKRLPRSDNFADFRAPALLVKIGSARRGSGEEPRFASGQATQVIEVEVSFRDEVFNQQTLSLSGLNVALRAFSVHEVIAEKLRALLQQPIRNRYRRQDIFDIAFLIERTPLTVDDCAIILETLIKKCNGRDLSPHRGSLDDEELKRRAKADWSTLALEIGKLPSFDERFEVVRTLYVGLPWPE